MDFEQKSLRNMSDERERVNEKVNVLCPVITLFFLLFRSVELEKKTRSGGLMQPQSRKTSQNPRTLMSSGETVCRCGM